ncbi:pyridoxamine 5'-phosphate oxidase family protein [Rhizobiaceae bacterium n13]|uniref:Pyridoxamine 5'-phosphate oxidase family protein n=1 Tax=Ferirhizobium litorale TaxID=2927786 RepID=A0AAE3QBJ4_9HYPH|nr:pyridoxamine 5'-phosphate oxidase family protein [Fererhizobium litorale]MDI7860815.1 pyridoxamine 5'-phosphate oxidase family protein [Fererhizobium litorale]MDI7920963.1 pyridoxamine 5'-phosphate oxidase family protein [Fererhizobium litorale]
MNDKPSVIRETDDDARRLARILLRSARYASLAVLDPDTGFPFCSRVLVGTDCDGVPAILVSGLSAHTKALNNDPRASLLFGKPGKGDPLAHPRLTVQCVAERVETGSEQHQRLRQRFLNRHPKAKLYIDFPDFAFFRLVPQSANLNGGFARAYNLPGEDLIIHSSLLESFAAAEQETMREIVSRDPDAAAKIATLAGKSATGPWRICGIDLSGIDLICGDHTLRHEFDVQLSTADAIFLYITKIAYPVPEI